MQRIEWKEEGVGKYPPGRLFNRGETQCTEEAEGAGYQTGQVASPPHLGCPRGETAWVRPMHQASSKMRFCPYATVIGGTPRCTNKSESQLEDSPPQPLPPHKKSSSRGQGCSMH